MMLPCVSSQSYFPYERVAQVMSKAAKAGLVRIGFVTDPSLQP